MCSLKINVRCISSSSFQTVPCFFIRSFTNDVVATWIQNIHELMKRKPHIGIFRQSFGNTYSQLGLWLIRKCSNMVHSSQCDKTGLVWSQSHVTTSPSRWLMGHHDHTPLASFCAYTARGQTHTAVATISSRGLGLQTDLLAAASVWKPCLPQGLITWAVNKMIRNRAEEERVVFVFFLES